MSASNKKKLRREQDAVKLTEKQLAAQKEAKKTNLITIGFVALMAVILVAAIVIGVTQTVTSSGVREKKTVALTVGDHKISNAELNYFYMDAVNNFATQYGSYAALLGLDTTKPLNEQVRDEATGETWADSFLASAQDNAKSVYALADAAEAAGFTLPQEQADAIEQNIGNLKAYAALYGYSDGEQYVKALFGNGATSDSYRAYMETSTLANAYYSQYAQDLTYADADIRAKEAEDATAYSSYSYNVYYVAASKFLEGGTQGEDGSTTYSDEEKASSVQAAKEAADAIAAEKPATEEALNAAIAALPVNEGAEASSTAYRDTLRDRVAGNYAEWVTAAGRKAGDLTVIANTSTSTDEDGKETTVTNGYYVVLFTGSNDNTFPLANVRHILVSYEGGTKDPNTGVTTYTDEEKAAAMTAAQEILSQWESGEKTEESFAALATEKSTDSGSKENGGLYENVYPGQMVTAFNDWCFDASRKSGDTGIVETEYGCHVMYYVGDADITYRDYQITEVLRSADMDSWYTGLVDAMTVTEGDSRYIRKDLVINAKG